ncbi:hypothetical protein [Nitrosopumilus sp. b1]|uniref:hypothetical protein n=1 Tax=Nitrosopumilus sp. b1 TaxID=2109907 RepID=UPI0015F3FD75|nr:hypothetical protein [Nitrosopumilus sp. b1]
MSKLVLYGSIVTIALFLIGVLLLSFTEVFSDYWLTGIAMMGIAIAVIVITLVIKFRR